MLQNVIVRLQLQYSDGLTGQTLKWEFEKSVILNLTYSGAG